MIFYLHQTVDAGHLDNLATFDIYLRIGVVISDDDEKDKKKGKTKCLFQY